MNNDKIRLLLVEDEEAHAGLIRRAFKAHGSQMSLTVVDTLKEAREFLAQSLPHLLIVDMLLPDGLGVELLCANEDDRKFPTIVMTSFGNEQAAVDALKTGAIDYVVKSETTLTDMPHIARRALREWKNITDRKRAEEDVVRAKEEWERTFDAVPDLIVLLDKKHRVIRANEAMAQRLGTTPQQCVGKLCYEVVHGTDRPPDFCPHSRLLKDAGEYTEEVHEEKLGGDFLVTVSPLFDAEKRLTGSVHVARDVTERKRAEEMLRSAVEGTSSTTGEDFFRSMVQHLAAALDVRYGFVGEMTGAEPEKIRTLAVWNGEKIADNFEYDLTGTPCENIVGQTTCLYPAGVQELFPEDPLLAEMGVISYLGAPLTDSSGRSLGVLAVLDDKPFPSEMVSRAKSLLEIFAARAAAELERIRAEDALRYRADFERIIAGLSSDFVRLDPEQVDDGIQRALETVGRFVGVDRSYAFMLRDDDITIDNTHEWCAEGIESQMPGLQGLCLDDGVPWLAPRIRNLEDIHVPVVAALPPEAELEKEHFQAQGIQSLVTVPMVSSGHLKGFLGFDSVRSEKQWSDDAIALLRIVGEIFTHALERKRAEEALRKSERRYRTLVETAQEGIGIVDAEENILFVNQAYADMLGYTKDELLALNLKDIAPPSELSLFHQQTQKRLRRESSRYKTVLKTKSGETRQISISASPLFDDDGTFVGTLGLLTDVTLRERASAELAKAKDAAEAANRAKSEFLANMSHEIRTPMTAIMGFTDLLMSYEMPRCERREHLQTIHRNAENLLTIINDILDLSKIEADKIELEHTDCTLREIVDEVLSLMKVRANEKNLSLDAQYVDPLPKTIRTDAIRLRQILVNLVGNAVKFTESPAAEDAVRGRVRITVRCRTADRSRPQIVFEVMDTGIGMKPEDLDLLFRPFVQVDASHSRRFGGTGLGLSISERLAKMLGGRIDVQSQPGRGSTFSVSIDTGPPDGVPLLDGPPSITAEEQLPADLSADLPADTASLAAGDTALRGRVLLVEDSPDIRNMVLLVLQHWGREVDVAENGQIGCEKALQSIAADVPYDLILMDIQLPEMDGYQATQHLRRHGWSGPVVALTAHAMDGDRQRCLAAGCDDYVPKPITAEELLKTLAGYLGDSSAADAQSADYPAADGSPNRPLGSGILDETELAELVDAFVGELPDRVEAIREALKMQDLPALALRTHQLKGTAAVYGLPRLSQAAAAANQWATHPDDFEQLEAAVTELIGLCRAAVSEAYGSSAEEGQIR